jgi:hypothetical protein
MEPPTNALVTRELKNTDYLNIFYLIERSWSDYIDADPANRDVNRDIMKPAGWSAAARLNYGVVEYRLSSYAGVALSDAGFWPAITTR